MNEIGFTKIPIPARDYAELETLCTLPASTLEFIKTAMKRHGRTREIVTDGLRSYGAPLKALNAKNRRAPERRWKNNRAKNSHLPFRQRERAMIRSRRTKTLQNSPQSKPRSTTTSPRNATRSAKSPTANDAQPPWPNGGQS